MKNAATVPPWRLNFRAEFYFLSLPFAFLFVVLQTGKSIAVVKSLQIRAEPTRAEYLVTGEEMQWGFMLSDGKCDKNCGRSDMMRICNQIFFSVLRSDFCALYCLFRDFYFYYTPSVFMWNKN
ncbi:hypothetical protein CDAR_582991 [Caerostris darwini]|uniref:Uncharacterized protein n=1 Tax=Caerostris darwini TaxID=1538125 RepID=A0AAV4PHH1_9ARAC|nr:hypothetical protein CDAR_582991 [Caerostris darwini]